MKDYFAEDRLVLFSCFGDVMDSASEVFGSGLSAYSIGLKIW
jgi:hypothetical protein